MPRRDGTGPKGAGPLTGRGLGLCSDAKATDSFPANLGLRCRIGRGRGMGRGLGRGLGLFAQKPQKELLQQRRELLQNRLNELDEELKNL